MEVNIIKIWIKSIYIFFRILRVDWMVNQYVGCVFVCFYCYVKFFMKWKDYGKWGSWVEVKVNVFEFVRKRVKGSVVMLMVSDFYQLIEVKLKFMRWVFQYMDKRNEFLILMKLLFVIWDIDFFRFFDRIEVGLIINGFRGREKRFFEFLMLVQEVWINVLKEFKEVGLKIYVFVSFIILEVIDIFFIVEEIWDFVDYYFFEVFNFCVFGREF